MQPKLENIQMPPGKDTPNYNFNIHLRMLEQRVLFNNGWLIVIYQMKQCDFVIDQERLDIETYICTGTPDRYTKFDFNNSIANLSQILLIVGTSLFQGSFAGSKTFSSIG